MSETERGNGVGWENPNGYYQVEPHGSNAPIGAEAVVQLISGWKEILLAPDRCECSS